MTERPRVRPAASRTEESAAGPRAQESPAAAVPSAAAAAKPDDASGASAKPVPPAPLDPALLFDLFKGMDAAGMQRLTVNFQAIAARLAEAGLLVSDPRAPRGMLYDRPDPFNAGAAIVNAAQQIARDPLRLQSVQVELFGQLGTIWGDYLRRLQGGEPAPAADKRFKDPEWRRNPQYELLMRTYLAIADFFERQAANTPNLSEAELRKVKFFTRSIMDSLSPANFALVNPQVLRAWVESGGETLLAGIENYIDDVRRGKGNLAISQTDSSKFVVGGNIATAPGKVIFRNRLIELIHYAPTTETVFQTPLLIFPPWINKFYIMDLTPANSMIRWLVDQGFSVFLVSWANPDQSRKDLTFEDYSRDGVFAALDAVEAATGEKKVNVIGYCIGGTMLATTLAYLGQTGDKRVKTATFFAAQTDFAEAGELLVFTDDVAFDYLKDLMDRNDGLLDGQYMSATFNMLRGNDLIWRYWIDNYLLGKTPPAFDLLYWNADQTRMTRGAHLFYLDNYYRHNRLARDELSYLGKRLSLRDIKIPVFFQAGRDDHIAPYQSIYRGARHFGGPVRYVLAGSGHIAGVINHPAQNKYQHWVNDDLPATADSWLMGAEERKGSWWPSWFEWLAPQSGPQIAARDPEKGGLAPLCDAPGEYVHVKS